MAKSATATASGAAAPKPTKPNAPRVAPVLTAVSNAVSMPERSSNRGSKTSYPFEALTVVGMSFGVVNKTAANLASIISNQNRKAGEVKKDANGAVVYKTQPMTAPDGTVTHVPTGEPERHEPKHFFAVDCDPKKDPDKANVRVFRDK